MVIPPPEKSFSGHFFLPPAGCPAITGKSAGIPLFFKEKSLDLLFFDDIMNEL